MKTALSLITLLAFVSCQTQGKDPKKPEMEKMSRPSDDSAEKDFDPKSLVGMPLEKAQKACDERKLPHRVVEIDGQPQIVTRDFRPERLNFTVNEGKVTAVTMG
ncbi:MAG: hypothetical protein NWT08_10330 [Akkermansiaceae bacterium]|jgi:hypothetical protein|nr:hypothetical protein [Akkermansiaceae bacterium]MDP4647555.1 hypothetical protein [Akkermansiaceae bacterium]MDP4720714.1 hypothetical protein [Akkermansiaceae bacterium]MDP4779117.1 hypothetical protein [Akkermansiaceae bacterium]MDP4897470.1 hypothetical protein [Akkermansiaceae bacterium]